MLFRRTRHVRKSHRVNSWRHVEPRQGMWRALHGLSRHIVTPTVARHRLFVWLEAGICPDHRLIVVARDDDVTFGILHSRFHEAWSLRLGTWLGKGNDPRYTPTTTFETFRFPDRLSPVIRASDYADDSRGVAIADAAWRLVGTTRSLAQPARMGGLGGRAGSGISQASGRPQRDGSEGTEGPHADKPVQCPPAMTRRCPRFSRCCGRRCVRMGRGSFER